MSATSSSATGIMSAAAPAKSAKRVAKKTEDAAPVAAATPAVTAPAAAPAKASKAKAAKAEATPAVAAPAPVVAAPAVAAPAVAAPADAAAPSEDLRAEVQAVTARLLTLRETLSELITESKKLEKRAAKLQKLADKRKRKSRARAEGEEGKPATESVFTKPVPISPAMCKFLGRAEGSTESRCNVTKFITNYVKEHNLKAERHGINPDAKLRSLLGLKESDKLTYFNLQTYLNTHYIKTPKTL